MGIAPICWASRSRSGVAVDDHDLGGAHGDGRQGGHVPDRAAAVDDDGLTGQQPGHFHRVPAGGEDVGQHHVVVLLVAGVLGQHQGVEVGPRHAQQLGLAPLPGAHVGEPVGGPRDAGLVGAQAVVGALFLAVAAVPAGDVERGRDHVANLDLVDRVADLDDLPYVFVAEDAALLEVGAALVHVQV